MAFIFKSSYSLLKNEGGAGEMAQQLRALVALVRKFGSQHPHGETQSITYNSSSGDVLLPSYFSGTGTSIFMQPKQPYT